MRRFLLDTNAAGDRVEAGILAPNLHDNAT